MSLLFPKINGELVPQSRSGHTAVLYQGQVLVHGGYGEAYAHQRQWHDVYMDPSEIWSYNVEVSQWTRLGTRGKYPNSGLSGACACVLKDCMIVYGGFEDGAGRTSSVYQLDLVSLKWRNLTEEGVIQGRYPSKRDKLVCWVHNNKIIYFGGFGVPPTDENGIVAEFCYEQYPWGPFQGLGWNDHVFVLDMSELEKIQWKYPETKGQKPHPRAAHATTKVNNKGFVFGGRSKAKRLNDMYCLDLDKFEWKNVKYNSAAPCGRSWHCLNKLSNKRLILYGGLDTNGDPMSDIWLFDIENSTWHQTENVNERLGQYATRMWHTGVGTDNNNEVMIFGGCINSVLSDDSSIHSNLVVIYRSNPLSLEQLCIYRVLDALGELRKKLALLPHSIQKRIYLHLHARGLALETDDQANGVCALS